MQTIYLDISNKGVVPTIYAKQGDVGRKFRIVFTNAGLPYNLENCLFSAWYKGDGGEGNYTQIGENSAFFVDGNCVEVELITQMLSVPGYGELCVVLSDEMMQIGSWNIPYVCDEKPGANSDGATEYYTAFSKIVDAARKFSVDKTLTRSGSPADAAETGRQISVERARINQFTALPNGSTTGDAELLDIRVGYDGAQYPSAGEAVRTQVGDIHDTIAKIVHIPENNNLIDWDECVAGYILLNTGVLMENDIGWVTNLIHCTPGQSYVYSVVANLTPLYIASVAFFDGAKSLVGYLSNITTYTAPANAVFMQLSVRYHSAGGVGAASGITADTIESGADYRWRKTMLQIGTEPSEPGEVVLNPVIQVNMNNLSEEVKEVLSTWYSGRKIVVYGDSIVELNKWQPYVAEYFGCTMYNQGVGGTTVYNNGKTATVTQGTIEGWMCGDARINRIGQSYSNFDAILVLAGHNDCGEHVELGNVSAPLSDATFKSAYALMLKKLQATYDVPIICMTPISGRLSTAGVAQDVPWKNADGLTMRDYAEAVLEVCAMYGIPCVDLNATSGINTWNAPSYLSDVVHPNDAGGVLIAQAVINGLLAFEPKAF